LVHGLSETSAAFCELPTFLKEDLARAGAMTDFYALNYSTFSNTKTQPQALIEVTQMLTGYFHDHHLSIDTPYAIIAHSEGGMISTEFVERCIHQKLCGKVPTALTRFVTLASPLWGSAGPYLASPQSLDITIAPLRPKTDRCDGLRE